MKRLFFITCVIVVSCVIASSMIASVTTEPQQNIATSHTEDLSGEVYVLGCDGDRIVAYIKGSERPYIETTTAVSSLPYDVQQKLREGIEFDSEEKLKEALNEYCS